MIDELEVREPAATVAEQRRGHERARRDGGDAVDLAHHLMGEPRDEERRLAGEMASPVTPSLSRSSPSSST